MRAASPVRAGVVTPSVVQAYAGRTLDFLTLIEKTIDCLSGNTKVLYALAREIEDLLEKLKAARLEGKFDAEGLVCQALAGSAAAIERIHAAAIAKRDAAQTDRRLHASDGVVDAYVDFIGALADHHAMIEMLRDYIATHDSLLDSPTGRNYTSVEELFEAMGIPGK